MGLQVNRPLGFEREDDRMARCIRVLRGLNPVGCLQFRSRPVL